MTAPARLLLTGAVGTVATLLRPALRADSELILTDRRPLDQPTAAGETFRLGELDDHEFVSTLTEGVDAIVHLGGQANPDASWPELITANVGGTATLLEAARADRVPRIVLASSVHAVGRYHDQTAWPVQPDQPAWPCCPYGMTKVAIEALGRLYADEVDGAHVVALRFGLVGHPMQIRADSRAWLADPDLITLTKACLASPHPYGIYFGISDCPDPRVDITPNTVLGWQPAVRVRPDGLPDPKPDSSGRCRLLPG